MTKLKTKVNIQQEIRGLQERLDALNKLLAEKEAKDKLPELFDRRAALDFLEAPDADNLDQAFRWISTPQGHDYWENVRNCIEDGDIEGSEDLDFEVVIAVQRWVIQSYKWQYGV